MLHFFYVSIAAHFRRRGMNPRLFRLELAETLQKRPKRHKKCKLLLLLMWRTSNSASSPLCDQAPHPVTAGESRSGLISMSKTSIHRWEIYGFITDPKDFGHVCIQISLMNRTFFFLPFGLRLLTLAVEPSILYFPLRPSLDLLSNRSKWFISYDIAVPSGIKTVFGISAESSSLLCTPVTWSMTNRQNKTASV